MRTRNCRSARLAFQILLYVCYGLCHEILHQSDLQSQNYLNAIFVARIFDGFARLPSSNPRCPTNLTRSFYDQILTVRNFLYI